MITEYDLKQAIAECQGVRNPTANTCIKLASYLIIQKELYGTPDIDSGYSFDSGMDDSIHMDGDSDFILAINGKDQRRTLLVIDELMNVLQSVNPNLYESAMRKIRETA